MPDPGPTSSAPDARTRRSAAERAADHRAIERLAADVLPALIARLADSGLGELGVREGPWKVRLRRPLEATTSGRHAPERQGRSSTAAAAGPGGSVSSGSRGGSSSSGGDVLARGPAHETARGDNRPPGSMPTSAVISPAVGIFRPRSELAGNTVRNGDRLGIVDTLGIAQDILAPADGVVGGLLAEPGDGVEYGQALIELRSTSGAGNGAAISIEAEAPVPTPAGDPA